MHFVDCFPEADGNNGFVDARKIDGLFWKDHAELTDQTA